MEAARAKIAGGLVVDFDHVVMSTRILHRAARGNNFRGRTASLCVSVVE